MAAGRGIHHGSHSVVNFVLLHRMIESVNVHVICINIQPNSYAHISRDGNLTCCLEIYRVSNLMDLNTDKNSFVCLGLDQDLF